MNLLWLFDNNGTNEDTKLTDKNGNNVICVSAIDITNTLIQHFSWVWWLYLDKESSGEL